jgi:hypothetical protein
MDELLRAAGRRFLEEPAPEGAVAKVELDVTQLAKLIPLDPAEGQAQEVVGQWQEVCL